ncbi:DUF2182 domain-containing protein [Dongia soli]|uniref:DUF2182 domain-containing protein n=1 Tax=Dongia soli TaxID=600628 RepID=A0ABU5E7T3_9PROT|nr:DUF2182 domain-containing protein [Dongia soli]MDY0882346.1 DUF2182 domain-containing protein [Dongia soli]
MVTLTLENVLRRDRWIVVVALAAIVMLSWIYILSLVLQMHGPATSDNMPGMDMPMSSMPGMDMSGPKMSGMAMAGMDMLATPHLADQTVLFLMWVAMMIGMMIPAAAPMILLYARVARKAAAHGKPFAATGWFAAGYLLVWAAFSLIATLLQGWLQRHAFLSPDMAISNRLFAGFLLIAAGLFQWGSLKDACLSQCRMPLQFIQQHGGFSRDAGGSLKLGMYHGAYCVGCCWALMALLFVGGVMNMLWIAGLTILVLLEKIAPFGRNLAKAIGVVLMLCGVVVLATRL